MTALRVLLRRVAELDEATKLTMNKNRLIILSGPSCVGKTPLIKAFYKLYSKKAASLKKIVLYNSRAPRPAETEGVDYFFRSKEEFEKLRKKENFVVMNVRGDLQALDTTELIKHLKTGDVFFEGNTYTAKILLQHPLIKNINKLSIFLSPFSKDEILKLKSDLGEKGFENYVFNTMKSKLIRRAEKFKQEFSEKVMNNIDQRAADAYHELKDAWKFDYVIPNRDGEGSDNWEEPIPESSDAYIAVKEFSILL
jgi:guanylate kinase